MTCLRSFGAAALVALLGAGCAARVAPATIADAQSAARVKTALINDPVIGLLAIEVHVTNGVVRLTGVVPSGEEAERAVALARAVPGVSGVQSALRIGGAAAAADLPARAPPAAPLDAELNPPQSRRFLAVGGAVGWSGPRAPAFDAATKVSPIVRLGSRQGLGLAIGFGWFAADLTSATRPGGVLGRVRVRPVLVGADYTLRGTRAALSFSVLGGPAFNSVALPDRVNPAELALDVADSLVLRSGVSLWFDLSGRVAFHTSVNYVVTRPTVTLLEDSIVVRRRLRGDTVLFAAGLAYKVF